MSCNSCIKKDCEIYYHTKRVLQKEENPNPNDKTYKLVYLVILVNKKDIFFQL